MYSITTLMGNVGGDPEVKKLQSGISIAKLSLATSKRVKQQDGEYKEVTQWHNLIFWDKKAEVVEKYVKKGSKIFVTGEIEYRSYDNKDGQKVYVTEIVVNELKMLDSKKDSDKNDYPSNEPKGAKQETSNDIFEVIKPKLQPTFIVIEGEQQGKIVTILEETQTEVRFKLDAKEMTMSNLRFSEFNKKMNPYTPPSLDGDDDLPF